MHKTQFLNGSPLEKYFYKLYSNTLTRAKAPNSITINGSSVSDPSDIAENFNHHFVNVGKNLISDLNLSNRDQQYLTYLKSPCSSSTYLYPTTPHEIIG